MDELSVNSRPEQKHKLSVDSLVRGLGILSILLCVIGGVARLIPSVQNPEDSNIAALGLFGVYLALGVALAGLLFGLAAMLRHLDGLQSALIRVEKYQYEIGATALAKPTEPVADPAMGDATLPLFEATLPPQSNPPDGGPAPHQIAELLQVLQDIRDTSLLTEDERRDRRIRMEEIDIKQATESVRQLSREGDYARARQIVENLRQKYPSASQIENLFEQIESDRERFESHDIVSATKQIEDLMTIAAWQRARQVAEQLLERHPEATEPRQLLLRLEREHKLFQDEQRRRMHAEVQRFVSRKRWEEALVAAKTFMERFPGCPESEGLMVQVPTLEANAEIERRQQLEAQIMDFAKHGRYIEAASLARKVIDRYPDSPQADALKSQLGRLEELANNPDAPPARVRIE